MSAPTVLEPAELPASTETGAEGSAVVARMPDFPDLSGGPASQVSNSLDCLLDVTVTITAELGRTMMPIGEVLKLGVGSVLALDRSVAEPVDLVVQGVRLARGEVVVVGDHFGIRIKEIMEPKKRQ